MPIFRQRRYLSGLDWVISALDCSMKRTTASGNAFQIVLVFDAPLEESVLRKRLMTFLEAFPVLQGKIARGVNLAPYWKAPENTVPDPLDLTLHPLSVPPGRGEAFRLLEECVNRPFKEDRDHLAFHLIQGMEGGSRLVATFDHKIFDARGGELFLGLFLRHLFQGDGLRASKRGITSSPSGLSEWVEKFYAGRAVNRKFVSLSRQSPRILRLPRSHPKGASRFRLISFDEGETSRIFENAHEQAGYLMEMPYLLASALQVMHTLFERRNIPGSSYIVPVTVDKRSAAEAEDELFFNYASFLFIQVSADSAADRKALIRQIKHQMYEQVRTQFHQKLWDASMLMRIAPLSLLDRILSLSYGRLYSFSFSYLGKASSEHFPFADANVKNLFHMPRVPVSPGVGLFFNVFDKRLNAVITWTQGLVEEDDIHLVEQDLRSRL